MEIRIETGKGTALAEIQYSVIDKEYYAEIEIFEFKNRMELKEVLQKLLDKVDFIDFSELSENAIKIHKRLLSD